MPAKIRLQRYGKKGMPFYHIVIADGRAPRDGKYIERIGTYNPIKQPADISIDVDQAVAWLNKGAQPTDTVRAILSYTGVLYKNHLMKGVTKGALTEEQAEAKFQIWLKEKEAKIEGKLKETQSLSKDELKARHEAEVKIKEERAAEVAKKRAAEIAASRPAKIEEEAPEVVEEVVETVVEEPKAEVVEETPAVAEVVEPAAEAVVEEPVAEEAKEESEETKAE